MSITDTWERQPGIVPGVAAPTAENIVPIHRGGQAKLRTYATVACWTLVGLAVVVKENDTSPRRLGRKVVSLPTTRHEVSETELVMRREDRLLYNLQSWGILVPCPQEVAEYLRIHPDMNDVVDFVCRTAVEKFRQNAQLSLEVYHDPEIEDRYLTLYVRQQKYDPDIMKTIKDIRRQHKEDLHNRSGWLLVTTDFKPPQ